MSYFLGLDVSTQSLSAVILDGQEKTIVAEETIHFGTELPHYNCSNGFLQNQNEFVCLRAIRG